MDSRRLIALDGLRGVAALVVLLWHFATLMDRSFATSMLAVDLFFLISGFVIPYAYEGKLLGGLSVGRFFLIRVVRLYPLYILGVAISLVPYVVVAVLDHGLWHLREPLRWLPWAVLLLPRPVWEPEHSFLLNPPAWSLFFEVAINLIYAATLPRLSLRVLFAVLGVSTAVLVVAAIRFRSLDFGTGGIEMMWGAARVTSPFTLGVILYRLRPRGWPTCATGWALLPPTAFIATLLVPTGTPGWALAAVVVALGLFPVLTLIAVAAKPGGAIAAALHGLGELSYPLYVLHLPIFIVFRQFAPFTSMGVPAATLAALPAALAVSTLAIFLYDRPIRLRLEHALGLRRRNVDTAPPL